MNKPHSELEQTDVLFQVRSFLDEDKSPTAIEVTEAATDADDVDSNHPAYRAVNDLLNELVDEGLLNRERFGRSFIYELTDAGEKVARPQTTKEDAEELVAAGAEQVGLTDDPADKREPVGPVDERDEAFSEGAETVKEDAEEDSEPETELDEILEGEDIPDPSEIEDTSIDGQKGKRRVEGPLSEETEEAPTHWPPEHPEQGTREINTFLTHGENCYGSRLIISEDAVKDGLVASLDEVDAQDGDGVCRVECPHCGRTTPVDVRSDGQAKMKTHAVLKGTARPRKPVFRWDGDEESGEWIRE